MSLILVLAVFGGVSAADESSSTIKSGVKSVVSDTVSAGKNLVSGIVEGVDEGRKGGDSLDGARLVANTGDLKRLLKVRVVKVEEKDAGQVELTVALQNDNDFPVRVTNLDDIRNVVLLDKDGFSYTLPNTIVQAKDITALGRSATRVRFIFSGLEADPDIFRFFDVDTKCPDIAK